MCSRRWESGGTRQRKRLPTTTFVYKPLRYKCVLTTNVFSVLTTNVFSVLTLTYDYVCLQAPTVY